MGTVATVERAGAPAPALLSVRGLTCRFGEVVANDGLDFDVAPGEVHAVLGENGAGKSTLMKLIYGVYRADAGELHVNGAPATIESPTAARAAGSTGSAVALEPLPDTVVAATGVSGCFGGPLETALREAGIDHVLLAGHGLEGPVHSTLRDLNDQGYECLLVADACTSGVPDTAAAAVSSVTMSGGIFGAVGSTDSVLTALTAIAVLTAVLEAPHDR